MYDFSHGGDEGGDDGRRPLFVEPFAGSASLSKAVREYEFDVVAVDWGNNKHVTKLEVMDVDLLLEKGRRTHKALFEGRSRAFEGM